MTTERPRRAPARRRADGPARPRNAATRLAPPVVPGELLLAEDPIALNPGRPALLLRVLNTGDRPVQVGSHLHFPAANDALDFDREAAWGHRLDVPAGTAVRFEPGIARDVGLVPLAGTRTVPGLRATATRGAGAGAQPGTAPDAAPVAMPDAAPDAAATDAAATGAAVPGAAAPGAAPAAGAPAGVPEEAAP